MIAERIRFLREQMNLSQTELGKKLGVTRSSINSYEQAVSTPSTHVISAMAKLFHCSTDFLLGMDESASIGLTGLSEEDKQMVYTLVAHLRRREK